MMKYIVVVIALLLILLSANTNAVMFLRNGANHIRIDHAAPTDENGCHEGPTGYHCHR